MGCNFYTLDRIHIGKRSAAGYYCWDCGITLCKGGIEDIHSGFAEFFNSCPQCEKKKDVEGIENSAAGRELGFNKGPFKKKKGLKSCSSFNWAVMPHTINKRRIIVDEYRRRYLKEQFDAVLQECPIQFFNSIGKEFQ